MLWKLINVKKRAIQWLLELEKFLIFPFIGGISIIGLNVQIET